MKNDRLIAADTAKYFVVSAFLFSFTACNNFTSSCYNDNCLYLTDTIINYNCQFIHNEGDTTFYDLKLQTSKSFFLLQRKLQYTVERKPNNRFPNGFRSVSTTGFKESSNRVWLHPPRADQFKYITQLAPYPEVKLPVEIGDTLSGNINMLTNWGEWSGKSSNYFLQVETDTTIRVNKKLESAFILKGCGNILEDTSCVTYHFLENHGFVFADYKNNKGERFIMKMKELY